METNWYVVTGGPSCGKTKVIEYLSFLGYRTVPEAARVFFDVEMSKGRKLEEIRANEDELQRRILQMKIEVENRIPCEQLTFFDRGIPDSIAYFKMSNMDTKPVIEASQKRRYKGVFFLEQLVFEKDYARTENEEVARKLGDLIYDAYNDLGYKVIRIPVKPIDERARLILDNLLNF
ncbi:MAG: ATP-binding protein [Candidatus Parvarchaeota archaeon]|nr:ATP-binding protein [Candidatus Jingweiarchaeum tengchongense]MCW1298538.1 ATP-binding protein [Candidatus Jingweiarchaeum tengchongense]MCW1300216.1 ATP-binding protein [Candidatus Jingweiarchaeum tengchongense]MCW1304550.1 ATP-binding protein [Candidatus Jingweiarchaeum tengchongense]MCW1305722.1 ATP-binding protein [Candidatus Jingweiarchaeum tengchongense]